MNHKTDNQDNQTKHQTLTVQTLDKVRYGSKLMTFLKNHQKFLILQGILILLIALSFVFW